jgi:hypothetical protein
MLFRGWRGSLLPMDCLKQFRRMLPRMARLIIAGRPLLEAVPASSSSRSTASLEHDCCKTSVFLLRQYNLHKFRIELVRVVS